MRLCLLSVTALAPEFLTANRSPASPAANKLPEVAPYKTVFPILILVSKFDNFDGLTISVAPDKPFPISHYNHQ